MKVSINDMKKIFENGKSEWNMIFIFLFLGYLLYKGVYNA